MKINFLLVFIACLCYDSNVLKKGYKMSKISIKVISSEYPMGTVDGINYSIYPRA